MNPLLLYSFIIIIIIIIIVPKSCLSSIRKIGTINPGFTATQMSFIDNDGLFLLSNSSQFAFGFVTQKDNPTLFQLSVLHMNTQTVIWSANRASLVGNSDEFTFDLNGTARLNNGDGKTVWSAVGDRVVSMELWDSGNLVLLGGGDDVINGGSKSKVVWESFGFPTDTLLQNQNFSDGMKLVSNPSSGSNLSYSLQIQDGDMMLYVGFSNPQPYWSLKKDSRKTINKAGGNLGFASMDSSSWNFYDPNGVLLWQYSVVGGGDPNGTWIAVLGNDGLISFKNLLKNSEVSATRIPRDSCGMPEACEAYLVCSEGNKCSCPSSLSPWSCEFSKISSCEKSMELVEVGDDVNYFALEFVSPVLTTSLDGCKSSCLGNCSCVALFFHNGSGNCFTFDSVGSFQQSNGDGGGGDGFVSYVKVNGEGKGGNGSKHFPYVAIIGVACFLVVVGVVFLGYYRMKGRKSLEEVSSSEDNFFGSMSGMPIRFNYKELQSATQNFSVKLGQGGFGSVYKGVLDDGTRIAVKQLEGVGQGKKEFRAEVSIIGSIHHIHLVRLKGFCAEGAHRLLVYEFMSNGSLDKWIFKKKKNDDFLLDWDTRFNIALGTAKGLAYLHEDCDVKIVHCDIKPENVLLDDNFNAKVSDFGLAKLMNREQSHVFTTLRGTRGYLAPEWITNYAISEKSDVYSFGMVLLEIVGGRKNFDPSETSEKSHFPSYVFKMMEEGKVKDIWDQRLLIKENDERIETFIRVALWCIQDDMNLRPSMTKVVQMLEGLCLVPIPPVASPIGSRLFAGMFKSMSGEGTSSGASVPSDQFNSDTYISAVRLSGPR